MDISRDGNVACARVGRLWIGASGPRAIADNAWREYLQRFAAAVKADGPVHGVLFWALTQGPSPRQRMMLTHEFADVIRIDAHRRIAVVSDSALVRGTITAINWFVRKNLMAFPPREVPRALEWLSAEVTFDLREARSTLEEIVVAVEGRERKGATS